MRHAKKRSRSCPPVSDPESPRGLQFIPLDIPPIPGERRWTADDGSQDFDLLEVSTGSARSYQRANRINLRMEPSEGSRLQLPPWLFEIDEEDHGSPRRKALLEELDIDITKFITKVRWVLFCWYPRRSDGHGSWRSSILLQSSDFWGPFSIVLAYALILLWGQFRVVPWVSLIWLVGTLVLWFLDRALGDTLTFQQCLAVTGYSVLPMILITLVIRVAKPLQPFSTLLQLLSVAWSSRASYLSLVGPSSGQTSWLIMYPVVLLHLYFMSLYSRGG